MQYPGWPAACLLTSFRVCRNLRIRTRAIPDRVEARAPDLRGHWAHKDENSVDPALILRLRQNRAYDPSGTVYNLPSSPQIRGRTGPRAGGKAVRGVRAVVVVQVRSRTRAQGGAGCEDRNGGSAQTPDQAVRQPAYPFPPLSSRERYLFVVRTVLIRRENGTCSSRERYLLLVRTVLVRRENGCPWLAPAGTRSCTV